MKVALFVPCYMDLFFADAAMATVRLLESLGVDVDFPDNQTCCGQPMANTGCTKDARPVAEHFVKTFSEYDTIVCPSGSCASMVRHHYHGIVEDNPASQKVCQNTWELSEFLLDHLKITQLDVSFPHKVGIHQACHGLRELRLGPCSERRTQVVSKMRVLLEMVDGLEIVDLDRPDECCGFGGTFSVNEEAVSVSMGRDRIGQHEAAGADYIVSGDASCLMHMNGLINREKRPIKTLHLAEVLAGGAA